jgi:opacity protein-like surface antigen
MKRKLVIIAALAMLAIPAAGSAAPARPGPYVAGFIGATVPLNQDVTTNDFRISDTFNDRVRFDPGINVGGIGGFDFGFVRLEGELSYKHAEITSVIDRDFGDTFGGIHGSVGAFAVMTNGFIDLHNDSPVTPYLGGGIGFATLHLSDTSGILSGGTGTRVSLYDADDDTVFAYQAGAGLEIALNRRLSLDLGYRYFATSRARFNEGSSRETSMKFESHNGAVGLRFKF